MSLSHSPGPANSRCPLPTAIAKTQTHKPAATPPTSHNNDEANLTAMDALHDAALLNDVDTLRALLTDQGWWSRFRGSTVNSPNSSGATPLHNACCNGAFDCASLLLEHKANPNSRDKVHCDARDPGNYTVVPQRHR
eukprot:m.162462 g.162462  ORF g.162462 m.162462 type:complete len:137 (-) comp17665_c1_seq5:998-1408(-)